MRWSGVIEMNIKSCRHGGGKWSFGKIGIMGTLASQAEIGVWVQAPGLSMLGSGVLAPGKKLRLYMQNPEILCILARNCSQCVLKH